MWPALSLNYEDVKIYIYITWWSTWTSLSSNTSSLRSSLSLLSWQTYVQQEESKNHIHTTKAYLKMINIKLKITRISIVPASRGTKSPGPALIAYQDPFNFHSIL